MALVLELAQRADRYAQHSFPPKYATVQSPLLSVALAIPSRWAVITATVASSNNILETVYNQFLHGNLTDGLLGRRNLSTVVVQASKTLQALFTGKPPAASKGSVAWQDALDHALLILTDFVSTRSALENTSIVLTVVTLFVLIMSWTSRLGNLGRFSPFLRSPQQGPTKVSDADFSYITADDLRRHQEEGGDVSEVNQHHGHHHEDNGPPRDTDCLILRNKKKDYHVHFPAHSIAKGELKIGQVRERAAKSMGSLDPRTIKLLYKGKNLKEDSRTCKSEGLKDHSELLCTIADVPSASASESEDEGDEFVNGAEGPVDGDGPKKRRNRGKKSKRRNKREAATSGTSTPDIDNNNLSVPQSYPSTRTGSPKPPPPVPTTPAEKLSALHATLDSFTQEVDHFRKNPPPDASKREFEHKRLSETILTQVLLKLDAVETDGDEDARMRRKGLVRETQAILQSLDAVMKK